MTRKDGSEKCILRIRVLGRKMLDEVTDRPTNKTDWANNYSEHNASKSEASLGQLLDNVAKQTSLEFVRTKRMIPVWFVREKPPTTQSVNLK